MESLLAVTALSALAHEGRLEIYRLLVAAGPAGLTVGEIGVKLAMPGATLSFHLSQLKHAGLVAARRDGRRLIQTADFGRMNGLVAYLTENCCGGQSCAPVCKPAKTKRVKAAHG
ncbi:MAG: metalloregulator ArsR/SmtB family transcription factor [Rhodospirillaceae bacterium]|nr:metalloregulator ArsR/SmtB family transcription factor [Rhodospirillaceae bacterium]